MGVLRRGLIYRADNPRGGGGLRPSVAPPPAPAPSAPPEIDEFVFSQSKDMSATANRPVGVWVSTDGGKLVISDQQPTSPDHWDQHSMTVANDLTTLTAAETTRGFATPNRINGVFLKDDGVRMFGTSFSPNNFITENSGPLSPPFDISSFTQQFSLNIGSTPIGLHFSPDGLNAYTFVSTTLRQYVLPVAFDPTGGVLTNTFNTVSQVTLPAGITFSNDGTRMFVCDVRNNITQSGIIYQYNLSVGFDISTAVYSGKNISAQDIGSGGIHMTNDNTLYVAYNGTNGVLRGVRKFVVGSNQSLSAYSFNGEKDVTGSGNVDVQVGLWVDDAGENLYTIRESISVDDVFWFEMSTGHDISTLSFTNENNADGQSPRGIALQEDGSALFVYYRNPTNPEQVFKWPLSTNWDVDTKGSRTALTADFSNTPRGLWFKPDGSELYLTDALDQKVYQYNLPTPWSFTGATQTNQFNYIQQSTSVMDLALSADGKSMYLLDATNQRVVQYQLITAWDISTAVFQGGTLSLPGSGGGADARGLAVRGKYLYICYNDNEVIEQFKAP